MKITSDFALLDVKMGRADLAEHFKDRPRLGECPPELRIPITIVGYIDGQASLDDGTSIEFSVQVEHLSTNQLPVLEWEDIDGIHTASTPLGTYLVWTISDGRVCMKKPDDVGRAGAEKSIDEAKVKSAQHVQAVARDLVRFT